MYLKTLKRQQAANPKYRRDQEIIKIIEENNEMEIKRIHKINLSWFFKKVTKIDKLLAKLTKKDGEVTN